MKGFFSGKEVNKRIEEDNCARCGLHEGCVSPFMDYTGEGRKSILIVSEAPGRTEDEEWRDMGYDVPTQLIGEAGQVLRDEAERNGVDIDRDCWKINSVNCRPPNNRKPTRRELGLCRFMIDKAIEKLKPKFIWLFGGKAIESFYMGRFSEVGVERWRGLCIPDKPTNAWILPMFHPSFLLHKNMERNLESVFARDMEFAVKQLKLKKDHPKFTDFESKVEVLLDFKKVERLLLNIIKRKKTIVIDYETSNTKPFGVGQVIWTIAVGFGGKGYAFPYGYPHWESEELERIEDLWKGVLVNPKIKKIGHNLKFEDKWSRVVFGVEVSGWLWCTMNAEHIIDGRKRFTGLKFQSYVRFGLEGYNEDVKNYISVKEGDFRNRLDEVPLKKLLLYNGIDVVVTEEMYKRQAVVFRRNKELGRAYDLFHKGLLAFSDTEMRGINVDEIYYSEQFDYLTKKIDLIERRILKSKEAKKFKEHTGRDLTIRKDISTKDLRILFYDVMDVESEKETRSGLKSVDAEVLVKMGNAFANRIIERRKLVKLRNTYVAQFMREVYDGRLHPFFDLHIPRSYRSSSSDPNLHNIPIRDEEAKAIVRKGVFPSAGHRLCCADYGGIEVRVAACYTKDPVLIQYIEDGFDMHHDQAKKIFVLDDNQMTKELRFYTKNQFVFPEFYGSYYVTCARNLKDTCFELKTGDGITVLEHLVNIGMMKSENDFTGFVSHLQDVEEEFWERFYIFREWQDDMIKGYQKNGYVETFFGHRRGGYLVNNRIINTPIQATAFHLLLWSFIKLNYMSKRKNWKSGLIGQVHDEVIWDLNPDEEEVVLKNTKQVMCYDTREEFDWIVVPLEIEVEMAPVDASWYHVKEVEIDRIAA